jgi:nucleoside-diphosphate-sugar epimerase
VQKLLIVGCGDVARRALPRLIGHYRVYSLLRDPAQCAWWRRAGAFPVLADLDRASSLQRIAGLADVVLHFAPPAARAGEKSAAAVDTRTRSLLAALSRGKSLPQRLVYISTSGVYGDCQGDRVDETRPTSPSTPRALRRVDAERQLRAFGRRNKVAVSILRAPGIYAADRLPLERLRAGTKVLCDADDVYTNHIHADDLAMLACRALRYGRPNRVYNASDASDLKMGEYFDQVAERFALPKPGRLTRDEAQAAISPSQLSFMNESRRLDNRRITIEFQVSLRYPTVVDGLDAAWEEWKNPKEASCS